MATTIGIIGLGQIGASMGLALKARGGPERILGCDRDRTTAQTAERMGAVDASASLKNVAKESQIVVLCLPLSEIREVLHETGSILMENAVVLDTAPIKRQVREWVEESVPDGHYYVGLVPAVNPSMLSSFERGIKLADGELFRRTTMMVIPAPGVPASVGDLAMSFVRLLGAKPMLTDLAEADGIMTTAHLLPQLTAAALVEASMEAGGWREARKLAGRPFTSATAGMASYDDPASVEAAALSNPSRVVYALDQLIAALKGLRDDVSKEDSQRVGERLVSTYRMREQWLDERNGAAWLTEGHEPVELPGLGEQITQLFFGGRIAEATRKMSDRRDAKK